MKYVYCYQTKENENRRGEINARDRADAYRLLRKQGIRPYRIIGDDPVRWQPWALGALILVLFFVCAVSLLLLFSDRSNIDEGMKKGRRQIGGDKALVVKAFSEGWSGVFKSGLDSVLAMYAQPGWAVVSQEFTDAQIKSFEDDLLHPPSLLVDGVPEYRILHEIVSVIRSELNEHISSGGSLKDYLQMLDKRQELESSLRAKAFNSVLTVDPSLRAAMLKTLNERLSQMGMAELETENKDQE